MALGLIGRKCGMTRVFTEEGKSIPVTVILATPNRVTQVKTKVTDGYDAIQVTAGHKKLNRINKCEAGHFQKANVAAGDMMKEFRIGDSSVLSQYKPGDEINTALFTAGDMVDVQSYTIGKGFAGGVKRHHFRTQDATHGNSLSHRAPGSIGQNQTPGRVFKGKRMAGHLGNVKRTIQNQEIVRIDSDKHIILVRGAVPGAPGAEVIIRKAVKLGGGEA